MCETSTVSPAAILALAALFAGGGGGARAAPPPRRVALGPMPYGNQRVVASSLADELRPYQEPSSTPSSVQEAQERPLDLLAL